MADLVGQQVGNYDIIRLLSDEGGFGDVYLGKHKELGTPVAIKVLKASLSSTDIAKFRSEAITIAKLNHPHIVRVFDYGVRGTTPYMVMDYAPHGTLRDHHPYGAILPLTTILSYVKQIAPALQYAHDQKIIHRDVKPENMLLDAQNNILVSDFGIAVAVHRTRSLPTQDNFGTIYFMAPEHIQGKPRPASDQYSLAIVVYVWLSGTFPFDGLSDIEIAMKHVHEPPPAFEKHLHVPPQVGQVVLKALAKDPYERFESVQEFATALEQAYQSRYTPPKPIPAPPVQPAPPRQQQIQIPQPPPKVQAPPIKPVVKGCSSFSWTPKTIGCLVVVIILVIGGIYGAIAGSNSQSQQQQPQISGANIVSFTVDQSNPSWANPVLTFTVVLDKTLPAGELLYIERDGLDTITFWHSSDCHGGTDPCTTFTYQWNAHGGNHNGFQAFTAIGQDTTSQSNNIALVFTGPNC